MSKTNECLGAIEAILKERADDARAKFRAVARQLADGTDTPPPDEVAAILDAAKKTANDLRAEVDRVKRRDRLKAEYERGLIARTEASELSAQVAAAREELKMVEAEHKAKIERLGSKLSSASLLVNQGERAKAELIGSGDPQAVARLKELEAKYDSLFPDHVQATAKVQQLSEDAAKIDTTLNLWVPAQAKQKLPEAQAALDAINAKRAKWWAEAKR